MNKLRKKQIKVAATAFIALTGGLTIWSCSQDELDDFGQPIYRYTAEEIATLRSLAEDYGVPEVKFVTESNEELPCIQEVEETIKLFGAIKYSLSTALECEDSISSTFVYRTETKPFPRRQIKRASGGESTTSELKTTVDVESYPATLTIHATWVPVYQHDIITNYNIVITGDLEMPVLLEAGMCYYQNKKISYTITGENKADVTYSCDLMGINGKVFANLSFHNTITLPPKPRL